MLPPNSAMKDLQFDTQAQIQSQCPEQCSPVPNKKKMSMVAGCHGICLTHSEMKLKKFVMFWMNHQIKSSLFNNVTMFFGQHLKSISSLATAFIEV